MVAAADLSRQLEDVGSGRGNVDSDGPVGHYDCEPMRITNVGHAGLFLETAGGTILTDPWFNPAFFASWFPFPANDGLAYAKFCSPDYLYVSHLHRDHFDEAFLRDHVSKDATVLLPDYPMPYLRTGLQNLGFTRFVQTRTAEPIDLAADLRIMIVALTAPSDGPIGDSCLAVDDGTAAILNQNDARPPDLDALVRFGRYDGHWLQFSGAIWYPSVYELPDRAKVALGNQKRQNGLHRARRYIEAIGARHVFPHAGPAAFLDDDLFHLNDLGQPGNPFPDYTVFRDYLHEHGITQVRNLIPGSTVELRRNEPAAHVVHPVPPEEIEHIYADKRQYLTDYQGRWRARIAAEKQTWAQAGEDAEPLQPQLAEWFEPLMDVAQHLCARIGERVLLDLGTERIVLDFQHRRVIPDDGADCRYAFRIADELVRTCVRDRVDDWVNSLFLSCRFTARRRGPYNEHVYTWFKSLTEEKARYVEDWLAADREVRELWRFGDRLVQRRCPHLSADLAQFGHVEDGVLTCDQHGWQFDIATGRCLTSDDVRLYTAPAYDDGPERGGEPPASPAAVGSEESGAAAHLG